jgi:hypothetical protein
MLKLGVRLTDDNFVCALGDGTPMQPTFITHEWLRAIKGTPLPHYRFHDLRHAHATHMLASGTHIKVASERLGHSKVGITLDLYSHVLPGMQEDAAAKVDAALRAAQGPNRRFKTLRSRAPMRHTKLDTRPGRDQGRPAGCFGLPQRCCGKPSASRAYEVVAEPAGSACSSVAEGEPRPRSRRRLEPATR